MRRYAQAGGVAMIRQYLKAGLIDDRHLAVSPIPLGQGAPLFEGSDLTALGYRGEGTRPHRNGDAPRAGAQPQHAC
jgi:dihydrofolate reductase